MYQKSKTGMWHKVDGKAGEGLSYPKCQSYNLDRPNYLSGEIVEIVPLGAKICKKCSK